MFKTSASSFLTGISCSNYRSNKYLTFDNDLRFSSLASSGLRVVTGRVPFDQNFRKFRFTIEWNRKFPENLFENFGQPLEVVLFSGNSEIPEIFRSIRPFLPRPSFSEPGNRNST